MITGEYPASANALHLAVVQQGVHPSHAPAATAPTDRQDDEEAKLLAYYGGDLSSILGNFWD